MRPLRAFTIAATLSAAIVHAAAGPTPRNLIVFDTPTSDETPPAWTMPYRGAVNADPEWERKSLPIGNGSIGGNVFGSIGRERVTLNEKSLWMGGPAADPFYWDMNKRVNPEILTQARQALANGDKNTADSLIRNNFNGNTPYNRESFECFTTLGEATVETGIEPGAVTGYRRVLDVDSSLVRVSFAIGGRRHLREFFASYPDSVMAARFSSPGAPGNLTFRFATPHEVTSATKAGPNALLVEGRLANNGMRWAIRIEALAAPEARITIDPASQSLAVDGSDDTAFIIAAGTDYRRNTDPDPTDPGAYTGDDPAPNVNATAREAAALGYNALRQRHIDDYRSLYGRVSLTLTSNRSNDLLPTPDRLGAYRRGERDNAMEELLFNYGRYLLISSSRPGNLPANLQGMWHNNIDGPWRVDYHNNINLQMNYWPTDICNLAECFAPFSDFVESLRKPGETTARSYFGTARGWTASISANPFGFTAPLADKNMSWNYIPTAGAWLSSQLWDHYLFTLDREWLRQTAYPLIKASADFSADILFEHNGKLTSAPSYSPEHGTADLGATYANAVTREILANAIAASEVLSTDRADRARWNGALDRIAPYQIGRHGQLQEWSDDIDDPGDTHRHTNHLFGIHPGSSIIATRNPDLADAARTTLAQRGPKSTGWAMGWRVKLYARLLDGDNAYRLLRNLISTGVADNRWDLHPPFQVDGNFGATAGMAEMLLQSHPAQNGIHRKSTRGTRPANELTDTPIELHLLPALPAAWPDGAVRGLRARGNFLVDIDFSDGKLTSASITSISGSPCVLRYQDHTLDVPTAPSTTYLVIPTTAGISVTPLNNTPPE